MNAPNCPRCGYDQSGAIAAWERRAPACCPLDGVCTECGLEFRWADVMRPWRHRVDGLFEHARGPGQAAAWALTTWVLAARPRVFWQRVSVLAPVVPWKLLAWGALVPGGVWVVGSLLATGAVPLRLASPEWTDLLRCWTRPVAEWGFFAGPGASLAWRWRADETWIKFAPALAVTALWPLLMLALGDTLRAARVRRAHIARAAAYSLAWIPVLALGRWVDGVWLLAMRDGEPSTEAAALAWPVVLLVICAWLSAWWYQALAQGFRLAQAGLIWRVLMIPALIAALATLAWAGGLTYLLMKVNA